MTEKMQLPLMELTGFLRKGTPTVVTQLLAFLTTGASLAALALAGTPEAPSFSQYTPSL